MANKPADRNTEANSNNYKVVDMNTYRPASKKMDIVREHVLELVKAGKGKGIIVLSVEVPSRHNSAKDARVWRNRYVYIAKRLEMNLSVIWVENENGKYNPLISLK